MISPLICILLLFSGSFLTLALEHRSAKYFQILLLLISFVIFALGGEGAELSLSFVSMNLVPIKIDGLSYLLVSVFHILALINVLYSWETSKRHEDASALFYLASAVSLVMAGDLFSLFVFWELLTLGAFFLLLSNGQPASRRAANRYLIFHIFGGLLLLSGIVGYYFATDSLLLNKLDLLTWYNVMIFLGVGVNAAFPILHTWVIDAYPEASPSGTVWLSALTTKTAAYALLRLFPGEELLIFIGAVMMVFPVFYAVIENNLRRVLSYSLINQVGLIVTGIGIGGDLALGGAAAHIVTDIFFKGLLFMSVGAVLYRTGFQNATNLGGIYKSMPLTCTFCIIGALSISAFPLFSGFISKSLIVSAAAEQHMFILWLVLLFASAAVLEHAGIKVPFFTFFGHDSGLRPKEAPKTMLVAMGATAFICIALGMFPSLLYQFLPYQIDYEPYTLEHIITQSELLVFAGLAFALMLLAGIYPPEKRGINLDVDFYYRRSAAAFYEFSNKYFNQINFWFNSIFQIKYPKYVNLFVRKYPGNIFQLFTKAFHLSNKQSKRWHESVMDGTLPVAVSILLALLIFVFLMIE